MELQVMEGPLILLRLFGIFIHNNWRPFMSEVFYLHKTFTDYVSDQLTHFGMSTNQISQQVKESLLMQLRFFGNFNILQHV